MLCAMFGWNWSCGSGEEDENMKNLGQLQRLRQTMDKWSEKLTWAFSSGELKTANIAAFSSTKPYAAKYSAL